MTKIRFLQGLREIGGTFAVIETERARCMFDFGFANSNRMDDCVERRPGKEAADCVRLGVLPAQDGIYGEQAAETLGLKPYGKSGKTDFLLLSHMHIDHCGGMGMLAPDIPVYMSEDSLTLYRRLSACGESAPAEHPNCIGMKPGQKAAVEDIVIRCVPVDHDVVGACGFLITTPDGTVAYTGDYRFHGFHPDVTEAFARTAAGCDVLISEGVSVSFSEVDWSALKEQEVRTESTLQDEIAELTRTEPGLIIINPYNRNVERLHHLTETVRQNGRELVLESSAADYLCAFFPQDHPSVYGETMPPAAEAERLAGFGCAVVSGAQIAADPEHYVLQLDYVHSAELFDYRGKISRYIHMDGTPLGEYMPSYAKLKLLLESQGIPYDYRAVSGHSDPWHLRYMVETVHPKTLVPLHSFSPERLAEAYSGNSLLPEPGRVYTLSDGELKEAEEQ
ncbi:MAG: MBL fold metallo-hydrolase [Lachnospiraceae bacterium]|jgi:ribonuclease J